MHGVVPLVFDDLLERSERLGGEEEQKLLILLNSSVDKFADDVAEEGGVGLAEFFYVELVSVERLDLLVVLLGHHFAELVQEDVFGLVYAVALLFYELCDGYPFCALFGQTEQFAAPLEINFPRVQNAPGDRRAVNQVRSEKIPVFLVLFSLVIGHNLLPGRQAAPIDHRFKANLNGKSLPLVLIKEDIVGDALLHSPVVVIHDLFQILVDNGLSEVSFEDGEVGDLFLVGFDFVIGGDVVDYAVYPHRFDVGDVSGLDLIGDVVDVSLIDLFLPQNFGLEVLLIPVRQLLDLLAGLVQQHLPINNLFLFSSDFLLKFA